MPAPALTAAFDPFEQAPDPMVLFAPDGAVLRANSAFRAIFRHWIGPNRAPWGRVEPPPFRDGVRRFDAAAPDGRRLEWSEREMPDGARLAIARDVTQRAASSDEAARAKTVLFATLTHELRTPLNGILGMAGLLAQAQLEPASRSYVAAIRQSGEHLLDIITEILDYSRLEAGRVQLDSLPFDPHETLQSVAELLSPKAHAKGVELTTLVRAGAPQRVLGDDGRLRQILFNLAGNAVKFTEQGAVVLELAPHKNLLRFSVQDTGPGVPPELQARIFEEFAQADSSTAQKHGGAGLGLAIVKRLARAMGGDVGLVSRPGQGARFWVDLPLETVEPAPTPPPLAGVTFRIVSPSQLFHSVLSMALEAQGARAATMQSDVTLIDGIEKLHDEEISDYRRDTRAMIALIAQEARDAIPAIRARGVAHYALKPVRIRSLGERIRVALGAAPRTTEAPHHEDERAAPGALTGMRVLLAEDNPINALLAKTLLMRAGCVVDVVGDGEEAVAAVSTTPYDLVFLDLRMPRLDGFGAARRIRALEGATGKIPLVALTADASEEDRAAVLAAGLDDFVTKPIDAARLATVAARFTPGAKAASVPPGEAHD